VIKNTFAGCLGKSFKPNEVPQNEDLGKEINKALKEPIQITQPMKFLAPKEIQNIIQEDLNPSKAPGYDLITRTIVKEVPRKGTVHLATVCKAIIRRGYFPIQWKVAQTIMIPNPGKPLEASSYRQISLPPIMIKIFEKPYSRDYARYKKKPESCRTTSSGFDRNTPPENKYTVLQGH
jgi:hypothetical protein